MALAQGREGNAQEAIFRLGPAGAHPQDGASPAEPVEVGGVAREHGRRAVADAANQRPQPEAARAETAATAASISQQSWMNAG